MARKQAREAAMKLLYEWSMGGSGEGTLDELLDGSRYHEVDLEYIERIVSGVKDKQEEIDRLIADNAIGWKLNRMPKVDVAILRLAVFEMFYCDDIPQSVSINEAVEMAKRYSSEKSGPFVNGLLGKLAKQRQEEGA